MLVAGISCFHITTNRQMLETLGEPWSRDMVKPSAISNEKNIENEDSKQNRVLMRVHVFKKTMNHSLWVN